MLYDLNEITRFNPATRGTLNALFVLVCSAKVQPRNAGNTRFSPSMRPVFTRFNPATRGTLTQSQTVESPKPGSTPQRGEHCLPILGWAQAFGVQPRNAGNTNEGSFPEKSPYRFNPATRGTPWTVLARLSTVLGSTPQRGEHHHGTMNALKIN